MPPPRVGLDIGEVLSVRNVPGGEEGIIHTAAQIGAYCFCVFFLLRYGPENLFIISRTDTGEWYNTHSGHQIETWVVRFVRSMGLFALGVPEQNMRLCTSRSGKEGRGPCARKFGLTHMVDDRLECLWSVFEDGYGNSDPAIKENSGFLGALHAARRWGPNVDDTYP